MIEQQLELELAMINRGTERYWKQQKAAVDGGRGDETSYSKRLLPDVVQAAAVELTSRLDANLRGPKNIAKVLLSTMDPAVACTIAVKNILQNLTKPVPVASITLTIGSRIEDDLKFTKFQQEEGNYYDTLIADFKRKNSRNYRYRHRVLTKTMNDKDIAWAAWDAPTKARVGLFLLDCVLASSDLIKLHTVRKGKKTISEMCPTAETLNWIERHMDCVALLQPDLGPCVVPPRDWVGQLDGGYHTYELAQRVPFVKVRGKDALRAVQSGDLRKHMQAANYLQKTPWSVNEGVLEAMQAVYATGHHPALPKKEPYTIPEFPFKDTKKEDFTEEQNNAFTQWKREAARLYTLEAERIGKNLQFLRVLRQAREYQSYRELYFVYQADFRGRLYATSAGLSPQGADFTKALLRFRDGMELGESGWFWLRVHGANTYGYDKDSYTGRVDWIERNREAILRSADDPVSNDFWAEADKPWQFLAFCREYREACTSGAPVHYISHLPVGLDGSCNGLQNFSAMLRDAIGGCAVNLTAGDLPRDIYQTVADVVVGKLRTSDNELAVQWLDFGINRKCTKKPVMTLPYGSTKQTCRESVEDYIVDNRDETCPWKTHTDVFKASLFLSDLVWESIGEVVVAARVAMDWLQKASRIVSKTNQPLKWTGPTGFVVYQANKQTEAIAIRTRLMGQTELRLRQDTDRICSRRQANGISPNFVHNCDSSHLVLTTLHAAARGITNFAMIHDDFGTHAANAKALGESIRVSFVDMYKRHDVLQEFKDEVEANTGVTLPDLPPQGDLDITEVLKSDYFFG